MLHAFSETATFSGDIQTLNYTSPEVIALLRSWSIKKLLRYGDWSINGGNHGNSFVVSRFLR